MNAYQIVEHLGEDSLILDSDGTDLLLGIQKGDHVFTKTCLVSKISKLSNSRYLKAYNNSFGTTWRCSPPKVGPECTYSWWYWEPDMKKPCMAIIRTYSEHTVRATRILFDGPFKAVNVNELTGYWMQIRCEVLC